MSNEVVKEEFSFTFSVLAEHCLQRLYISRDLTKIMEVLDDSKCRIYAFKGSSGSGKEVKLKLINQIKRYPTPLQGTTTANFLFSPNFNYYFDVDSQETIFVIKNVATSKVVFKIARGMFGFKMSGSSRHSIVKLAKNMMWMSEDKIRIINKYGLDTVMQLNASQ